MNKPGSNHLTIEERREILRQVEDDKNCKEIADIIGKDPRTISREIRKRRNREENGRYGLYGKRDDAECRRLNRFPYVCNACPKRAQCFKKYKYFYEPDVAQENYKIILTNSRIGLDITFEDKIEFDRILSEGISKGQSIHHIVCSNRDKLRYSERSVYRLIDKGQTTVQNIDLRRKVKLKPRKHYDYKQDCKPIRKGRTYADYIAFLAENPTIMPAQIDTVESVSKGEHKCLLTIHFPSLRFMLIYILESKTKDNVNKVFQGLQRTLGSELYKKLFPVILTDRGTEFCSPESIEYHVDTGERLTKVFFCDSYSSFQKGAIEENHTLIRYIIPKGVLFDNLTQDHINLIVSHINSYSRKVIGTTPIALATAFWGTSVMKKFQCSLVQPNDVFLSPKLVF